MRIIRQQPFCWAEKNVLRLLKSKFKKSELVKMKYLYFILTEIDSDFNGKDIKYYTKTIATYSGLSKAWIPGGLKELEKLGIISIIEEKENGKYKGKKLIFQTSETLSKTVTGKADNGESINGFFNSSEHIPLLENNIELENSLYNKKDNHDAKDLTEFFDNQYKESANNLYESIIKNNSHYYNDWLDTFDKLIRIDKEEPDTIRKVITELFTGKFKEFWIDGKNFRTAVKFRQKMRDKTVTYFEFFKLKLNKEPEQCQSNFGAYKYL